MSAVKLAPDIYWVGAIDWHLRNFHGYLTQRGSTYNAFLIVDEKITLIDTVKHYLTDEMLERIREIADPEKIEILVINHVEMDHSGALPRLKKICPKATIYCSPKGEEGLKAHYREDWNYKVVKTGDGVKIGKRRLQFVNTPMVHWPDNMVEYCPEEKILFSNDSFGQHLASSERFDDEYPLDIIKEEAKKYFANIVLPYTAMVEKELEAVKDLDLGMIAPSHGILWRSHVAEIVEAYKGWAANTVADKAVIVYDTMWHATEKIAKAIYRGFESKGFRAELYDLKLTHISDIMPRLMDAKYLCVGSPTLNNNVLPSVAGFLAYLKGLAPKGRTGLAFGSYGWGGQSIDEVQKALESCSFKMMEPVKVRYVPDETALNQITQKIISTIQEDIHEH